MPKKRAMTPEALESLRQITSCRLSPDGSRLAFTVKTMQLKQKRYYTHIYLLDTASHRCRQFTFGETGDGMLHWSPDGSQIAFMRSNASGSSIYVMAVDGGEPRKVTQLNAYFRDLVWSPDGRKLAVIACERDEPKRDENGKPEDTVVRHITRLHHKEEGFGFYPKDRFNLWTVDVASGKAKRLFKVDYNVSSPCWSADSKDVFFIMCDHPEDPDRNVERNGLYRVSGKGGEPVRLNLPVGQWEKLALSPDGKMLATIGNDKPGETGWGWMDLDIWTYDLETGKATNRTPGIDRLCWNYSLGDTFDGLGGKVPVWSADSGEIYYVVSDSGSVRLEKVALASGQRTAIINEAGVVGDFERDAATGDIYYIFLTATNPGEIFHLDTSGKTRQLTSMTKEFVSKFEITAPQELWIDSSMHGDKVQGWVIKPHNYEEGRKYPAILQIHGGPHTQYANQFVHEFQYLAGQGFVVMYCNPHGSQGYGKAFSQALEAKWGEADYSDQMDFVDAVLKLGFVDEARLGVTGGSYGGYMTNYIIGHTTRFAAACTQRCISNAMSFLASDFGYTFFTEVGKKQLWEDLDIYVKHSPILNAHKIKTPTLVIHSELDYRCPMDQGDQMFAALQICGVESEYLRFPEEGHGLSRGGRPDRRLERLRRIAGWFDKYLK